MGDHGAVLVGDELGAVVKLVPYLEHVCDVHLRATAAGAPTRVLPDEEVAEVVRRLGSCGQGSGPRGSSQAPST